MTVTERAAEVEVEARRSGGNEAVGMEWRNPWPWGDGASGVAGGEGHVSSPWQLQL